MLRPALGCLDTVAMMELSRELAVLGGWPNVGVDNFDGEPDTLSLLTPVVGWEEATFQPDPDVEPFDRADDDRFRLYELDEPTDDVRSRFAPVAGMGTGAAFVRAAAASRRSLRLLAFVGDMAISAGPGPSSSAGRYSAAGFSS